MLILHVTSSQFCLYLLNIYHFTYTFSHAHTEAHTHTSTHVQSAHKRNGDNQAQEPGWEGWKKSFLRDLAHRKKKCHKKSIFTNLKKIFEHIELSAKLLDYFLRSNKSKINQCMRVEMNVLWGRCSVLCVMCECGKEVGREWLWQPGSSRAPRLVFQTQMCKQDIQHVMPSGSVSTTLREKKSQQ